MGKIGIVHIVLAWVAAGLVVFGLNTYRAQNMKSHWIGLGGGKSAATGALSTIGLWPIAVFKMVKPS